MKVHNDLKKYYNLKKKLEYVFSRSNEIACRCKHIKHCRKCNKYNQICVPPNNNCLYADEIPCSMCTFWQGKIKNDYPELWIRNLEKLEELYQEKKDAFNT